MAMTQSEAGKLGWLASTKYREEKYKKIRDDYEANPKKCKFCEETIDWDHRRNDYCNHSCAMKECVRKSLETRSLKPRKQHMCLCGNPCKYNKWCSKKCERIYTFRGKRQSGEAIGKIGVRQYLLLTREHVCARCKLALWLGNPITLESHHIDGDHNNNEEENLELICPNCHSVTGNYKSKNNGKGRDNRRVRSTRQLVHRTCNQTTGNAEVGSATLPVPSEHP